MDEGIILRDKERSLYMNPVDKEVKELFKMIADEGHTSHYGNCLKWLIDQALEYQKVKEIILNQDFINHIIGNQIPTETKEKEDKVKNIKTLSGNVLKGGKIKDE